MGYRTTSEIGLDPLPVTAFNSAGLGGATALYSAVLARITGMERAIAFYAKKATVSGKFLVLTDGAENASRGATLNDVRARLSRYQDGSQIQSLLVYFETGDRLSRGEVEKMARDMGFMEFRFYGLDKSIEERRREFRHDLNLFSSRTGK